MVDFNLVEETATKPMSIIFHQHIHLHISLPEIKKLPF